MGAALPTALVAPDLHARVAALRDELAAGWLATPPVLPALGSRAGLWRQLTTARAARRLIDTLAAEVMELPAGEPERAAWRLGVRQRIQCFGEARLGWTAGYRRLLFADELFAASREFARAARRFDPTLPLASLWQALRNVWIGNSLQMVLERPVRVGGGLFAYSMLYPLTDNLLDDPRQPRRAKRDFVERFGRRLAGVPVTPDGARETAVFRLVRQIEEELPRGEFADVHRSLLAIHQGQVRSLAQHAGIGLSDEELLAISCEKGGTSVLADLYLVAGTAGGDEERFAFGYGVFLQLLDDLQDLEADLAAGHETLFTRAARGGLLDEPVARLARFIGDVLDGSRLLAPAGAAPRKDLIRRNCTALLVGAVADQPRRFSRGFRRAVGSQWPLSLRALPRLRRRAERRFRLAGGALEQRASGVPLLDWALSQEG